MWRHIENLCFFVIVRFRFCLHFSSSFLILFIFLLHSGLRNVVSVSVNENMTSF